MQATVEQLQKISILSGLDCQQLAQLQPHAAVKSYTREEIILHEGDPLPAQLFAVLSGRIAVKKTASTGKETILRTLPAGELFAAPALFGSSIAPATVVAGQECQILTIKRTILLEMIQKTPELALQIIAVLNERLQHLHQVVHGLASERAIVRLAQSIQAAAIAEGTSETAQGLLLRSPMPYTQIAGSIGITYEECARLFKQIQGIVQYSRGGKILVLDWAKLGAIAEGNWDN
ncbi:MAG TPA: cyclic nucleotide-binding protein [Cyanobacteria bacterium UBA11149]|nr:cyclic nucleotide-binding protein [Cyanobacteria bacterium UBA11367]HBE57503.1 cyclic nucleotide-binding protein [Cyanobacteria bacterium UBA11366]HBK66669.1 cyclic nucleotide-binding protein [Cyanobacteria bacterium UBA11166]HBR73597.1 cyclic nucleotide-binding protein [Cyanobacteria bacterium UBA11159]HBS68102.1 cyclic nucleotide-binding protein [Cyanobacteria bacterium UBA11153]HBW89037.1 cyclic nucleotide-binding protein [Cyanobacteria bacterium UBA11149]HCA96727.1 cyclic nucleotide-bi